MAREAKCAPFSSSSCVPDSRVPHKAPKHCGGALHWLRAYACAQTFIRRSIFASLIAGKSSSSRKEHRTSRRSRKQTISWKAALASNEPGPAPLPAEGATTGADRMRLPASTCARA